MIVDSTLSGGEEVTFSTTVEAQDAIVSMGDENPILITDPSNSMDEVIPGLTLNLVSADPAQTVQVNVEADLEAIKQDIISFVDAYNEIVDFINTQQSYDADTDTPVGVLFGQMGLMNIRNQLRNAVIDSMEGSGSLTSIFQLGINVELTGELTLNEAELDGILNDDLEGVKDLFFASSNVALSSFGGTASASSTHSGSYAAEDVINGDTSSDNWGNPGGGWSDGTESEFPDYLRITFDEVRTLTRAKIYTLNSDALPASTHGIKDYELQYLALGGDPGNEDDWQTYTTVTNNTEGMRSHYLNHISTEAIRLKIGDSNDEDYSRIIEFEAYEDTGIAGRVNTYLGSLTDATDGMIAYIEDGIEAQNEDYQNQIDSQETLMEIREENLLRQFSQMEEYMGLIANQSSWLTQQLATINSNWLWAQ